MHADPPLPQHPRGDKGEPLTSLSLLTPQPLGTRGLPRLCSARGTNTVECLNKYSEAALPNTCGPALATARASEWITDTNISAGIRNKGGANYGLVDLPRMHQAKQLAQHLGDGPMFPEHNLDSLRVKEYFLLSATDAPALTPPPEYTSPEVALPEASASESHRLAVMYKNLEDLLGISRLHCMIAVVP